MFSRRMFKLKKHTRRVQMLKISLPVFAFLCAATILVWPAIISQKDKFSLAPKPAVIKGAQIDMERVRFYSVDDKNQPMTVVAESIRETDPEKKIVRLENPTAAYVMNSGVTLTGRTPYGLAYQGEQKLHLDEDVFGTSSNGYNMVSRQVVCDYKNGTLDSDAAVRIDGPGGTLRAEGFFLYNKGDNVNFKKVTKARIIQPKENVDIASTDGMQIDQRARTITAIRDVVAVQGAKTINADKMVAYYQENKRGRNTLDKIIATGHVVAYSKDKASKITGDRGEYDPKTGLVTMTQNVVVSQGSSVAKSDKATLDLNKSTASLNMNKKGGRIRGTLVPAELKEKGDGKK